MSLCRSANKALFLVLILTGTALAPEPPSGYIYWKTLRVKATAYCPCRRCCGRFSDGKTATMSNAWKPNGVAVNPSEIPYGTMVYIPGVGYRIADDRGPRGRNRLDVRYVYHWQARRFGKKYLNVRLYRKGRRMEGLQKEAHEIVSAVAAMIKDEKYGHGKKFDLGAVIDDLDELEDIGGE